jgi:shikimate kinase
MMLFFVGMPGSGKSTTAQSFAKITGLPRIDLDEMIEKSEKQKISEIFESKGEEYFRTLETRKLESLQFLEDDLIISVGGGTPCFNDNLTLMRQMGIIVFLDPPIEVLEQRVRSTKDRPLLATENIREKLEEMYSVRLPFYRQADYRFSKAEIDVQDLKHRLRNQLEYKA